MRLAIIGLPASGKSTVFNALCGENLPTGGWSGGAPLEAHVGTVDVPDPRLEALRLRFNPGKTTHAKVTFVDFAGLQVGGRSGLPGPLVNQLEQTDGFLLVLRAFPDQEIPHPSGSIDPARDLANLDSELLLHDMLTLERILARLRDERAKLGGRERSEVEQSLGLFERLSEVLVGEQPLRTVSISEHEKKSASEAGLLTHKPMLILVNLAEGQPDPGLESAGTGREQICLQAKLEMEIGQLTPEEALEFQADYGIEQPMRERIIRRAFALLNQKTFFSLNEKELRAWAVRRETTAVQAAGVIHSDLERGFIRAEVIAWDELLALGGLAEARASGKLRLEGKGYCLADGEVMQVRFNV